MKINKVISCIIPITPILIYQLGYYYQKNISNIYINENN